MTYTTGEDTCLDNDGKSIDVDLSYTVLANQVAYIEGFLGITGRSGDSGDMIALNIDQRAYQFTVPSTLSVSKGDTVYVTVADLTGHTPDDTAYTTSSGAGNVALFKALEDKDANNVVRGILLPEGV